MTSKYMESISDSGDRQLHPIVPGIYVPTLCFFNPETEDLDLLTIGKHAVRLAQAGVTGLTIHGSNGEAVHLSNDERSEIIRTTRKALNDAGFQSMPLMAGCSANSTRETIKQCQDAYKAGADCALVLTASYYRTLFTPDSVIQYFHDVADASPIPIIIYNYPPVVGGLDLDSDTLITLSKHPNIIGCKFTCGNTGKLNRVVAAQRRDASGSSGKPTAPGFLCFGGSGDFTLQTLIGGGVGIIGGIGNLAPKTCVQVEQLFRQGKLVEAQKVQEILARGDWAAIQGGVVGIKSAMMSHCGYGGYGRKPLPRPTEEEQKVYAQQFRELVEFENSL
ncbi:dihydrodipicolinate synthase, putative [Coccidioides posadasii C735 delta SOWgp]|uniref:Dihydrodipicolinate synthase, putative n=1 Tax=Coccidioides posadasii (strain C735) TaxID=222929 RepID=C5P5F4_COCP7|nr:dihydrodipicolinate synthase, putative [Coccidioides posadasii C735 delta SOWgp]EER27944.1 dihydrodipicolinate synthase, putative [Coccidioides posadasii C735 delta SOWgp]|eukprot:XP_003070089.1 dihydrodipicolinate synthase, putative [Coccidioides posadasii C735 delta SOWgp]